MYNPEKIAQELALIEQKVPGALQRMYTAADNGMICGQYYGSCALAHAVMGTEHEGDAEQFGTKIGKKLYGVTFAGFLELEQLVMWVEEGETPDDNDDLELLQELINEQL